MTDDRNQRNQMTDDVLVRIYDPSHVKNVEVRYPDRSLKTYENVTLLPTDGAAQVVKFQHGADIVIIPAGCICEVRIGLSTRYLYDDEDDE